MLRRAIIAYGLLSLAIAVLLLLVVHAPIVPIVYLAVNGGVVTAALLFERRGYRPALDRSHGVWEASGERFIDPSSGQLVEVHYNPQTGQRNYVPIPDDERKQRTDSGADDDRTP